MLDHVGRNDLAQLMRTAIDQTLNADKVRTGDLGGVASTQAIVRRLSYVDFRPTDSRFGAKKEDALEFD